jgi:orotate phosphoribosyltransferase
VAFSPTYIQGGEKHDTEGYVVSGTAAPPQPAIERLRELLQEFALTRRTGPVELSNGSKSTFYFDCKRVTLHPEGAVLIGEAFLDKLKAKFPDVEAVGGLVNGASPIVNAIIMLSNDDPRPLQGFYVRPQAKPHGLKHLIENEPPVGTKVVIVDDVVTSGSSLLEAARQAKTQGCIVIGAISLVDRSAGGDAKIKAVVAGYEPIFTKDKDFPDPG